MYSPQALLSNSYAETVIGLLPVGEYPPGNCNDAELIVEPAGIDAAKLNPNWDKSTVSEELE